MIANEIFADVMTAMQTAEDIGGPEGREYIELMERIAAEAIKRAAIAREILVTEED